MKKRILVICLVLSLILCFTCNIVFGTDEDSNTIDDVSDSTSSESIESDDDADLDDDTEESTDDLEEETEEIEEEESTLSIEEGTYEIYSKVAVTKVISVSSSSKSNAYIYERENTSLQKWSITSNGDGTYTIKNKSTGKVLDVSNAGKTSGTNVQQYTYNGTDAQKWYIEDLGNGYYNIISKCNGLYLDVSNAGTSNNTNIQVYAGNSTNAQKFELISTSTATGTQTIEDGTYRIYSKVASNRVIGETGNSTSDSKKIKLTTVQDLANQQFNITYNDDGTYTIALAHSGKVLDVERSWWF